ncbi:hypothetical protein GW17_00006172, partial [Ensete ventricosum]
GRRPSASWTLAVTPCECRSAADRPCGRRIASGRARRRLSPLGGLAVAGRLSSSLCLRGLHHCVHKQPSLSVPPFPPPPLRHQPRHEATSLPLPRNLPLRPVCCPRRRPTADVRQPRDRRGRLQGRRRHRAGRCLRLLRLFPRRRDVAGQALRPARAGGHRGEASRLPRDSHGVQDRGADGPGGRRHREVLLQHLPGRVLGRGRPLEERPRQPLRPALPEGDGAARRRHGRPGQVRGGVQGSQGIVSFGVHGQRLRQVGVHCPWHHRLHRV